MLRARPIFVTAIILSTLAVACGQRPAFKKADSSPANGIFEDDKAASQDPVYEDMSYSSFTIKNNQVIYESMDQNGKMQGAPVGEISKGKGASFTLKSNISAAAASDESVANLAKWINGKDVQVFVKDGVLTLKNVDNKVRHYRFVPEEKAQDSRKLATKKIEDRSAARDNLLGLLQDKTIVLVNRHTEKWNHGVAEKNGPAEDLVSAPADVSDVMNREPQSEQPEKKPKAEVKREIKKPVPVTRPEPRRLVKEDEPAAKIPGDQKLQSGKLVINVWKLSFFEKDRVLMAKINDKYDATVDFRMVKARFGEVVAGKETKRLVLQLKIPGLDANKYDIQKIENHLYWIVVENTEEKTIKLVRRNTKDRAVITSYEYKIVDSSSADAKVPVPGAVATPATPVTTPKAPAIPAEGPKAPVPNAPVTGAGATDPSSAGTVETEEAP